MCQPIWATWRPAARRRPVETPSAEALRRWRADDRNRLGLRNASAAAAANGDNDASAFAGVAAARAPRLRMPIGQAGRMAGSEGGLEGMRRIPVGLRALRILAPHRNPALNGFHYDGRWCCRGRRRSRRLDRLVSGAASDKTKARLPADRSPIMRVSVYFLSRAFHVFATVTALQAPFGRGRADNSLPVLLSSSPQAVSIAGRSASIDGRV